MIFRTPFTTRPPERLDWAGGVRGFVALVLSLTTTAVEIAALLLLDGGSWIAGFLVAASVFVLVPASAFACAFGGAWKGPARAWGIIGGIAILVPPIALLAALFPYSLFYALFVGSAAFVGQVIGRSRPPKRRFD